MKNPTQFPKALLAELFGALDTKPEHLTASLVTQAAISGAVDDLGTIVDAIGIGSTHAASLESLRRRLSCAADFAEMLETEEVELEGGLPHPVPPTSADSAREAGNSHERAPHDGAPTDFDRAADAVHDGLCEVHRSLETAGDTARAAALEAVISAFCEFRGGLQARPEAAPESLSGAVREPEKASGAVAPVPSVDLESTGSYLAKAERGLADALEVAGQDAVDDESWRMLTEGLLAAFSAVRLAKCELGLSKGDA